MSKKSKRKRGAGNSGKKKRIARLRAADPGYPPKDPPPLNRAERERIATLLPKVMPYPTMRKHGPKGSLPNLVLDNPS
jgi:hypothetical protein